MTIARVTALVLFAFVVTRLAWLSDDSLITLRTALNITHGWGPGFNATEAVQGYTHPLWFLLWTGIGATSNQWILGILAVSVALSTGAVALVLWRTRSLGYTILAGGLLVFSNAFVEYSTSGLENPLSYLFIALGFLITLTLIRNDSNTRIPAQLSVFAGLTVAGLFLTRMDLILVVIPVILILLWHLRRQPIPLITMAMAALIPIALWFAWSRIAYSAWLPNTFTAKSNLDIAQGDLLLQGFRYFWVSLENDPVTLFGIVVGLVAGLTVGSPVIRAWAVGIALYLAYVVWIGGDFMAGRFFAVPLLVAVLILVACPLPPLNTTLAIVGVVGLVSISALAGATPVSLSNTQVQRWEYGVNVNGNIVDERSFYVQNHRDLKFFINNTAIPSENPVIAAVTAEDLQIRTLNEINIMAQSWPHNSEDFLVPDGVLTECGLLGTIGLAIGPRNHLIDSCALTDRFLAGIAFTPNPNEGWKPGHFERVVPTGYPEAVAANNPQLVTDPAARKQLTLLWEKIRP
jgi:arabinofuranosyltransferase